MSARESCLTISAIKYPFLIHVFVQSERHPFVRCFVITLMQHPFELFSFVLHRFSSTYFLIEMKYMFMRMLSSDQSTA